jgi:hypothetical protein
MPISVGKKRLVKECPAGTLRQGSFHERRISTNTVLMDDSDTIETGNEPRSSVPSRVCGFACCLNRSLWAKEAR